jgi:hypothetical protein
MSMTRKHYVEFAAMISAHLDSIEGYSDRAIVEYEINKLATDMSRMFKRDNPHFDVSRFREAAGLNKDGRNTPAPF